MHYALLTNVTAANESTFLGSGFLFDNSMNAKPLVLMRFRVLAFQWIVLTVVPRFVVL